MCAEEHGRGETDCREYPSVSQLDFYCKHTNVRCTHHVFISLLAFDNGHINIFAMCCFIESSQKPCQLGIIISTILRIRKLRLRTVNGPARSHTAGKWWS